jgi:mannose-6-phosphate isomerase-like protein (cupin superfamily)
VIIRDALSQARFRDDAMGKSDLFDSERLFAGLNAFEPGQEHRPHSHCDRDKIYVVLEGEGEVTIGDETSRICAGDLALAPADVVHSLRNPGPGRLVTMIVIAPPPPRKS